MPALRVNETKLTPGNAFVVDLFPLGGEKKLKYDEETLFVAPWRVLTCVLTLHLEKTQCIFDNYFTFSLF